MSVHRRVDVGRARKVRAPDRPRGNMRGRIDPYNEMRLSTANRRNSPPFSSTVRRGEVTPPYERLSQAPTLAGFATQNRNAPKTNPHPVGWGFVFGAGDEARTRYLDLGKVALYQMSYARRRHHYCGACGASGRGRTGDTRIFSPLLYQLSYRGKWRPRRGSNPRPPA